MRATSRILNLISSFLGLNIAAPSWYTGRLWLLRIGLYKLERPKQIADDWIWIIDHTIQLGKEKCLVILGIRQKHLPKAELYLKHEDVEPIALIPVEQSNGEVVFQQLEENIKKTGVPKQIVSDHGTDIKSGIASFCQKYNTIRTYDMKHKGAAILKRELKDEPAWQEFVKRSSNTGKKVQQTDLSVLAPPNQRSKARYMNVDKLIDWGNNTLSYLDHEKSKEPKEFEKSTLYQKLGWIYGFRDKLKDWKILVEMIETANNYINFVGLFKNTHQDLEAELSGFAANESFGHIPLELVLFVKEQEQNIADGDRFLGSSEIIESVIGKYKGVQRDQVKGGFTGMLLGLAASVSDLSMDTVQKAITFVSTNKVCQWVKDNVGKSVYSKRKEIHKIIKNMEQNRDDNRCPCQA
jgi:hypothetical protein